MTKRVAVIGGGLTGIGCLTELLEAGHDVRLFERYDDIGGVWHPSNCYSGLSLHGASAPFEYHDFPLPPDVDRARPISSPQVFAYLQSYFRHRGLYARAEFGTRVDKVSSSRADQSLTLDLSGPAGARRETFDYVVNTHGFTGRTLPDVKDAGCFAGRIHHSFDMTDEAVADIARSGERVVVVGGSKTATDMILRFRRAHSFPVWLFRKNYWFIRSEPLIRILSERAAGRSGSFLHRAAFFIGDVIGLQAPTLHLALWRALGFIHTFGEGHWDFTKYHRGRIDTAPMAELRAHCDGHGVKGEIARFVEDGIVLDSGRRLACDVVVFCTGSSGYDSLVPIEIDGQPFDPASAERVYRARVIPEIPGLIFTAFHIFSFGVANGRTTGRWIARYIENGYDEAYLAAHAAEHRPPLFSRPCYLFDSSGHFNVNASRLMTPFFESGELSKKDYLYWLWQASFAPHGIEPLDFITPERLAGHARNGLPLTNRPDITQA